MSQTMGFLVTSPREIGAGGFLLEVETKEGGQGFSARSQFGSTIEQTVNSVLKELTKVKV